MGKKNEAFEIERKMIEFFIRILVKKIEKNSLLFVLSDHGLTICKRRYLLPKINNNLPVGGGRIAFYKDVKKEKVEKEIKKRKIPADVLNLNELEDFDKKTNKRCYENFGDIVVTGKRNVEFKYPFEIGKKKWDLASHGGLSKEERFVNVWYFKKNRN